MTRVVAAAAVLLLASSLAAFGQGAKNPAKEQQIDQRNQDDGGILVAEPKIFDDSLLQQMLNAAESKLASMQVLDATGIGSKLGAVSGGRQTINSLSVNAQTPSLPGVTTVANGAGSTQTVTTAAPAFSPPTASVPNPSTSLPSSFGVSSSNILNEQMQLTYEIANLRLLLEGSLSDRLLKSTKVVMVKPRTTIGFSVTVTPRYKDAVAIVEVEVQKSHDAGVSVGKGPGEPPVVTALLPREKTYNVASIRESNVSIGGGAVSQIFGISGSFFHGSRAYFLVQDQDTLALPVPVDAKDALEKTAFLWQFRPVLGQHYLTAGVKQTFVQLAFPSAWTEDSFGTVSVTTYWRRYDQKKNLLGNVIPGSLREQIVNLALPNLKLEVPPKGFSVTDLEDQGNGQMLVRLHEHFLTDTTVRIGSTILSNGPGGIVFTHDGIEFAAAISDLATKRVVLVARDGSEMPLVIEHMLTGTEKKPAPRIDTVKITTVDETNSMVAVAFKDADHLKDSPPLVFVIGSRVFGYRDAPFLPSDGKTLRAIVPTALLLSNATLTVKPLFGAPDYVDSRAFDLPYAQAERVVLLEQGTGTSSFLLYGSRLGTMTVVTPSNVTLQATPDKETLRRFDLTADQIKNHKQMLIQRDGERPILVALPGADAGGGSPTGTGTGAGTGSGAAQQINVSATLDMEHGAAQSAVEQAPVAINADEAVFTGNDLKNLQTVTFNGKPIAFTVAQDGKSVHLTGLKASQVTGTATTQILLFTYKAAMAPVKLDIAGKK